MKSRLTDTVFTSFKHVAFVFAAATLACFFGSVCAQAKDFVEVTTPNFTVISVLNEKDTIAYIKKLGVFEGALAAFTAVKDFKPQVPLRIYLVGTRDWDTNVKASELMAGFVSANPFGTVAALNAQAGEDSTKFLFHEYVHFVIRNGDNRDYPSWFDEGLAELLSTAQITGNNIILGKPPTERLVDLADVGGARWLPLRDVLTAYPHNDGDKPSGHSATLGFYAQSWALMHYFIFEHPSGRKSLGRYLSLREEKMPMDQAFSEAFSMSIENMEALLKKYVERSKYRIVTGDATKMATRPTTIISVRQLTTGESQLELGRLMLRTGGKRQQAPALYDSILKSDPKNPIALAGKANALALIGRFNEADPIVSRAIELAPTNQEVLAIAGDIESLRIAAEPKHGEPNDAMHTKMFDYYHEAMILPFEAPEAFDTIVRYAYLVDARDAPPGRALMQLGYIRQSYPTQPHAAAIHARLLEKVGKLPQALDTLKIVAYFGRDSMREMANKEIARLESQLKQ